MNSAAMVLCLKATLQASKKNTDESAALDNDQPPY